MDAIESAGRPHRRPVEKPPANNIYRQYFTPAECRKLDSVPTDSVSNEIMLLRSMLAGSLFLLPHTSSDIKKHPIPLIFNIDLLRTFSKAAVTIGGLFTVQNKTHPGGVIGEIILEALRELDPYEDLE
jgi:hypothetical protein